MSAPQHLDRLAILARRSWCASQLPGGLTNVNVRVCSDDDAEPALDLVVRCSDSDPAMLDIDREAEHHNTTAAAQAGVGPPVREFCPDLRMLVIDHLSGRTLADGDFSDAGVLARAADAVRRLHAGPRFVNDFDMFARQATYRATIANNGFRLPERYDAHAAAWEDVRRALTASAGPTVPCNNDLLAANFIDDGEQVWLIDYEYSGNNDPCFELGNTATECGFSPELTRAWTEAYFGTPTPADFARVRLQMLCSAYGWSLWGFIQAATSSLDFDFWEWGMERFDLAEQRFADPNLGALLEAVARD